MGKKKLSLWQTINKEVFIPPAILLTIGVLWGILSPTSFASAANVAFAFVLKYFSWFYSMGTVILVVFCLWAGFSKFGKIRLGGEDAKPELSYFSWFAIALTSGIAIGIVFYGVAEPLTNLTSPPGFLGYESGSADAAESALRFTFMHWAIHPYAIYTGCALVVAFMYWNCKRSFKFSSALYPLIGEKADGTIGNVVNGIAIFSIVAGIGTSLGMGILQFAGGLKYVIGTSLPDQVLWAGLIALLFLIYTAAACSGLHKGIALVSSANVYVYFFLLIWAFIFGETLFIINNTWSSVGEYAANIVEQSFYLEPVIQSGWISGNSIFYWAWWLSFAPLVGLFLIKLGRGRTIREFVMINMIVPSAFAIAWFGIMGSDAIYKEVFGTGGIASEIATHGLEVALFAYLKTLPLFGLTVIFGFLAIIFSIVTLAESMTLTLADMTCSDDVELDGEQSAPNVLKIFWGALMGLIAYALLQSGGLSALQTAVIVCALPILVIVLVMVVAYVKSMMEYEKYDLTIKDEEKVK